MVFNATFNNMLAISWRLLKTADQIIKKYRNFIEYKYVSRKLKNGWSFMPRTLVVKDRATSCHNFQIIIVNGAVIYKNITLYMTSVNTHVEPSTKTSTTRNIVNEI
jgi:hypothetical protein